MISEGPIGQMVIQNYSNHAQRRQKHMRNYQIPLEESRKLTKTKNTITSLQNNIPNSKLSKQTNNANEKHYKRTHMDKVKKSLKFDCLDQQKSKNMDYEEEFQFEEVKQTEIQIEKENIHPDILQIQETEPSTRIEEEFEDNIKSIDLPIINSSYSLSLLKSFNEKEPKFSPKYFLKNHSVTPYMRSKMIDWFIEVLTSYQCTNETFFLAINLMDRFFFNSPRTQDVQELHLIGVTAIFIACKYEEIYPLKLQTVYERIAHKKLSCEQIKDKELEILEALDFDITGPSFYEYVILLLHLINLHKQVNQEQYELFTNVISYISKLVVFEYDIIANKNISLVAAGVLYVSFKILEQLENSFNLVENMKKVKILLKLDDTTLIETATQILWIAKNFDNIFQNLGNLKKYHSFLFDQLQKLQESKKNLMNEKILKEMKYENQT